MSDADSTLDLITRIGESNNEILELIRSMPREADQESEFHDRNITALESDLDDANRIIVELRFEVELGLQ
jgi:DNA-directed RNA polymerase specialized sigma subunit